MYEVYLDDVVYPVAPSSITTKINKQIEVITLANEGEVNRIKTPGLTDITMDILLPGIVYPFAIYPSGTFQKPSVYISQLEKLKTEGKVFKLVVLRKLPTRVLGYDFSMSVTLEDYSLKEDAEEGIDITASLNLKQYVDYGTQKVKFKKKKGGNTTTDEKKQRSYVGKKTGGTYTVKSGDCLWNISKKKLGKASRWKEIYKLNKSVIEKAAKNHGRKSSSNGHWIYPGTKLKLPKK